jgi:hypothetical protein
MCITTILKRRGNYSLKFVIRKRPGAGSERYIDKWHVLIPVLWGPKQYPGQTARFQGYEGDIGRTTDNILHTSFPLDVVFDELCRTTTQLRYHRGQSVVSQVWTSVYCIPSRQLADRLVSNRVQAACTTEVNSIPPSSVHD